MDGDWPANGAWERGTHAATRFAGAVAAPGTRLTCEINSVGRVEYPS